MAFGWMPCCVVGCLSRNSIDTSDMPSSRSLFPRPHRDTHQPSNTCSAALTSSISILPCSSDSRCIPNRFDQTTTTTLTPYPTTITWQMEDHLCPRLVQPQAACLLCLSRLSQEPVKQATTKSHNRVRFSVTTAKAPKPSHRSPAPTPAARPRTRARVDHTVQPAAPRPTPAAPTTHHHNSLRDHMPRPHDLDKFSANITTAAISAEAVPAPLPHANSPLYARIMRRCSNPVTLLPNPWAKPINSRRSLPTPR
jgi:hypothetical protein